MRFRAEPIDATTLALCGDLDFCSAPELTAALADLSVDHVELSGVSFLDPSGLRVLRQAHQSRPHGLTLRSPSRCVRRLLDLAGHSDTFRIVD